MDIRNNGIKINEFLFPCIHAVAVNLRMSLYVYVMIVGHVS